jgi:hypothetical protein
MVSGKTEAPVKLDDGSLALGSGFHGKMGDGHPHDVFRVFKDIACDLLLDLRQMIKVLPNRS